MLTPDELFEFIEELRQSGFNIGAEEYIAGQDVLLALAMQAQRPYHAQQLRTYLAPIFCTTPKQQEIFYEHFEQWLARKPVLAFTAPELETRDEPDSMAQREKVDSAAENDLRTLARRSRPWLWILAVSLILLTVVLIVILVTPPRPVLKTLSGIVVSNDSTAIRGATISFLGQTTYSDSIGHFSFNHLSKDSSAELSISHPEFSPVRQTVALNRKDTSSLQIQLSKPPIPPSITPSSIIIPLKNSAEEKRLLQLQDLVARINAFADQVEQEQQPQGWERIYLDYFIWIRLSAAILPLLVFCCWWLWQIYRRRLILEKRSAASIPELQRIVVKGATDQLFRGPVFRRIAQQLRRHRDDISSELHASATVTATIEKGGWFTPVYRGRQILPEYLILIDRASFQDQQARRVDEMIVHLEGDGVFIDRYYFDSDPRICYSADPIMPHLSLDELATRHSDHRLMIFSDGTGLMHPLTGRPQRWLELFSSWLDRALLTPVPPAQWRYHEMALSGLDFVVLPATQTGLVTFVEIMQADTPTFMSRNNGSLFPEMLQERPGRYLERHAPEPLVVDQLCVQLKKFLGNEGYDWLCGCAIYPMLAWDLTLYLGHRLTDAQGKTLLDEERLLALARLPWLRHGSMPDWLRLRLIADLSREQERAIRQALDDLLKSVLEQPRDGFALDIARPTRTLRRRDWRRLLYDFSRTAPEEGSLRDYVFITFMSGRKPRNLAVSVPNMLQRIFFRRGQFVFGLRPAAVLILASFVSLLVWAILTFHQPLPTQPSLIPHFWVVNDTLTSTTPSIARSNSPWSYYVEAFFQQHPDDLTAPFDSAQSAVSIRRFYQLYERWLADTLHHAIAFDSSLYGFNTKAVLDSFRIGLAQGRQEPLYLTMKGVEVGTYTLRVITHTEAVEGFPARPIMGVEVSINGIRIDTTDAAGTFEYYFKPKSGMLSVKIQRPYVKFKRSDTTFALEENKLQYFVSFEANVSPPRFFEVIVLDTRGQPIPGVKITHNGPELINATNANGVSLFTLPRKAGDKVRLTFTQGYFTVGAREEMIIIDKSNYLITVRVPDLKRISAIVNVDGSPLAEVQIFVDGQQLKLIDQTGVREDRTDANGKLEGFIPLMDKTAYNFSAIRGGYELSGPTRFNRMSTNHIDVVFTMRKVILLLVKTRTQGTQDPRPGVKVYFYPEKGQVKVATTDQNGEARFKEYSEIKGRIEIFDAKSNSKQNQPVTLSENQGQPIEKVFLLPQAITILSLTVLGEDTQEEIEAKITLNNLELGSTPLANYPIEVGSQTFTIFPAAQYGAKYVTDFRATFNLPVGYYKASVTLPLNRRFFFQQRMRARDYSGAVQILSDIRETTPGYTDLLFLRGFAYEQLKEFPNAQADYRKVIERDRQYAPAYYFLGSLIFAEAERKNVFGETQALYEEAISHFQKVLLYQKNLSGNLAEVSAQLFMSRYYIALGTQRRYEIFGQNTDLEKQTKRAWQEFLDFIPTKDFDQREYQTQINQARQYCPDCRYVR